MKTKRLQISSISSNSPIRMLSSSSSSLLDSKFFRQFTIVLIVIQLLTTKSYFRSFSQFKKLRIKDSYSLLLDEKDSFVELMESHLRIALKVKKCDFVELYVSSRLLDGETLNIEETIQPDTEFILCKQLIDENALDKDSSLHSLGSVISIESDSSYNAEQGLNGNIFLKHERFGHVGILKAGFFQPMKSLQTSLLPADSMEIESVLLDISNNLILIIVEMTKKSSINNLLLEERNANWYHQKSEISPYDFSQQQQQLQQLQQQRRQEQQQVINALQAIRTFSKLLKNR
jgi:hypothetical protein